MSISRRSILFVAGAIMLALTAVQSRALLGTSPNKALLPIASTASVRVVAEGKVATYPGGEIVVGTEVAGIIEQLNVEEKATVRRGDLIATLRADDLHASLNEARARVEESNAEIRLQSAEMQRAFDLWSQEVGSRQSYDQSLRNLEVARARRTTALASVERIKAQIAKTRIIAPIDGVIVSRLVHPGETVDIKQQLVAVADLSRLRIEADVDEYDTGRVKLGARVTITAEGFPGQPWQGRIEEIPDSLISRRLRSDDPARPVDTSILLVKIALNGTTPLRLGQKVDVVIDTK